MPNQPHHSMPIKAKENMIGNPSKIVQDALLEHSKLTTRQENDPDTDISDLFTDNKQLRTLQKNDWQILFGRRGTGKTTLLHKLSEVLDGIDRYATLTISLQKCIVDLPHGTPERIKGLVQFEKFIMEIGYLLYRIYTNRNEGKNKNRKITRLLNIFTREHHVIQESILKIATFAHRGRVYGSNTDKETAVRESSYSGFSFGFGAGSEVSVLSGAELFSAYANSQIRKSLDLFKESSYNETALIDFSDLRRDFIDLLDSLKIKTLHILIDEWSALDQRAGSLTQVFFAEYLKRAFFGSSRICLKISAIEHESIFSQTVEGSKIGLEIGADIFSQVNLDQIYNDRVLKLSEFFLELIYRRLKHCDDRIGRFASREDDDVPVAEFLRMIFENDEFGELIRASGGIPRDFINTFDAVAASYDYKLEKKWQMHRIREVIVQRAIEMENRLISENSFVDCVFKEINKVVVTSKRRTFLVRKDVDDIVHEQLDYLFSNRVIHRVGAAIVPANIRSDFEVYWIDYGIFLDWTRGPKGAFFDGLDIEASLEQNDLFLHVVNVEQCRASIYNLKRTGLDGTK